ncbi:hypothetical protein C8Q73DRAFT_796573, partial [Cubamyces lactineus]
MIPVQQKEMAAAHSTQDGLRKLNPASSVGQGTGFTEVHGSPSPECPASAGSVTSLLVRPRESATGGLQLRALEEFPLKGWSKLAVKKNKHSKRSEELAVNVGVMDLAHVAGNADLLWGREEGAVHDLVAPLSLLERNELVLRWGAVGGELGNRDPFGLDVTAISEPADLDTRGRGRTREELGLGLGRGRAKRPALGGEGGVGSGVGVH